MTEYYEESTAQAIQNVARAIHALGVNDAATSMGAIESHSLAMKNAMSMHSEEIAAGLSEVANALLAIADAISEMKK